MRFGFQVPFRGSLLFLFLIAIVYLAALLTLGLYISTRAKTDSRSIVRVQALCEARTMHARCLRLALAALLGGCAPGRGVVLVTADAANTPIEGVQRIRAVATRDGLNAGPYFFDPPSGSLPPAFTFSLSFDADRAGPATLTLDALDADQAILGFGQHDVTIAASQTVPLSIPIASAAQCADGMKDYGESDVDCGGVCPRCDDGKACGASTDCCSGVCIAGSCQRTCGMGLTCKMGQCVGVGFAGLQVTSGRGYACAIRLDRTVECWGDAKVVKDPRVLSAPGGFFLQIDGGFHHACGLREDHTIACWGDPTNGRLSAPPGPFAQVACSEWYSCARRDDGSVACWGDSLRGTVAATPDDRFTQVSAGDFVACGLHPDGTIRCWGENYMHLIDNVPAGKFIQVVAGTSAVCAIDTNDSIRCWGEDNVGQLDPPAGKYRALYGGGWCAIALDGTLACWGAPQMGLNPPPAGHFTGIDYEWAFPCALRDDSLVECWDYLAPPAPSK